MKSRILLVFDLDETLIYGSEQAECGQADFVVGPFHIYRRPHLTHFLADAAAKFDVAFWSSASADYVEGIVEGILPERIQPHFAWSRAKCIQRFDPETMEHYYLKDLKKIKRKGYDLDRILIIEDTPQKVERNYGNAIYVAPYFGHDRNDQELLKLGRYLQSMSTVANVRQIEKRGWRSKA